MSAAPKAVEPILADDPALNAWLRAELDRFRAEDAPQPQPLPDDVKIKAAVARLAKFGPVKLERALKEEAPALGCSVSALKAEVVLSRKAADVKEEISGRPFEIKTPEPWPEPVDGARLLDDLAATFRRFVILPEHGDVTAALWTIHTYAFHLAHITPILVTDSPEKGCGKTTLRDVLAALVRCALATDGISPAALFRVIEKWQPTVLLDDFDSWGKENDELRGVLNTGYRKGGVYVRCVGDDSEPRAFNTFAPKCVNLIGKLHPTLHDRAIMITLRRKLRGERVESLHGFDGETLRRQCARWVTDNAEQMRNAEPHTPEGLFNRRADNWRPLLVLADAASGDWPERARRAALAAIESDTDSEGLGVMLLADIRAVFDSKGLDRIATETLIEALIRMDERPWADLTHGKPLNPRGLSRLLKPFEIRAGSIRLDDGRTPKGYMRGWFDDAFTRYIPDLSATTPQTEKTRHFHANLSATSAEGVADEKPQKTLENKACGVVADLEPPAPEEGDPGPFGDTTTWTDAL